MRKANKICSYLGAVILAASMMISPVHAAGSNYNGTIEGTKSTTFEKCIIMDQQANVPNASFTYEITAGTAKSYEVEGVKYNILAGVNADQVSMNGVGTETAKTIVFTKDDTTVQDDTVAATEKYAKKTATLDFTACNFTEPGIYRYIITESGDNKGITNSTAQTHAIDVYVHDASNATEKKLTIAGYVLHTDVEGAPKVDEAVKSKGFTDKYNTSDLTIRKQVEGNQASHDKYFEFTVKITGAEANTEYNVDITNADAKSLENAATIAANTQKDNVTTLTADTTGTVTAKFYLQHNQDITIQGLAKGTTYEVTENAEDYTSTEAGVTDYTDPVTGTIADQNIKTSYLNSKVGVIPTGVIMTVAPFVAMTLLGGLGATTILMKKKKNEDEEV